MIETSVRNGIALIQIAHGKANALDIELCDGLAAAMRLAGNSGAVALVLTGKGRMFSAGVDLPRMLAGGPPYVRQFLPALHRLYEVAFFLLKPVIAAVNGHAIAGGCVLACCADRRLMAAGNGRIGVTELLVGVPFPSLAFEIMRFALAPKYFQDAVLGGATHGPDAALERGFIDEVVDGDALIDRAMSVARQLTELSPAAFAQTKTQIRQPVAEQIEKFGLATDAIVSDIWAKPETLAYMRNYVVRTLKT